MSYSPSPFQGSPQANGNLPPMSDVEGFLDEDGFIRSMLEDIVGRLPCFQSMRDFCSSQEEDALSSIRHGTLDTESEGYAGLLQRLRGGIPLRALEFEPFAFMSGGDPSLLPSVKVLLEPTDTWLLVEENLAGRAPSCLVYAWRGGKAYYSRNPDAAASFKSMVDKEALQASIVAARDTVVSATAQAVQAAAEARLKATSSPKVAGSPLQRLREAGFVPVGTDDMGPAMQMEADDGSLLVVCRGDGPSLARSSTYLLRRYMGGTLDSEQDGLDVQAVVEAVSSVPAPSPA